MNIKIKQLIMIILSTVFVILSCKNKDTITKTIFNEWIGKTIIFPDENSLDIIKIKDDTIENEHKNYKIFVYIDSVDCIKCKLQLHLWNAFIEKYKDKTDFLFYFYSKNKENLLSLLKSEQFRYKIYIDSANNINKLNNFHNDIMFHCFLLDKNNKVLLIGNPVYNKKIWELYQNILTGKIEATIFITTIEVSESEIELKYLRSNKTSEAIFTLKNTGTNPLIIQMVNASCGCTVPEWEKQPIAAGSSTEIKVKITPETSGYFNKMITVHCNTEEGQVLLKVKGMVE
jgi:hypothetical protein